MRLGGRFTLSDDSHGIDQIGLNFEKVLAFMENTGIKEVYCINSGHENDFKAASQTARKIPMAELKKHGFWSSRP